MSLLRRIARPLGLGNRPGRGPYAEIARIVPRLEGWCSVAKATEIARLIIDERARTYVEIGVFGGRSLIPAALAIRALGDGRAHGIDPWATDASLEGDLAAVDRDWWSKVDYERIYANFVRSVLDLGVTRYCSWYRLTAAQAACLFESIDVLYIDGNHSHEMSMLDVKTYLPKVRPGGVVIFDDVDWPTTEGAWRYLDERCQRFGEIDQSVFYRVPGN